MAQTSASEKSGVRARQLDPTGTGASPAPFRPIRGSAVPLFFQCGQLILDNLKYLPVTIKEARRQLNPRPVTFRSFILASRA